MSYSLPPYINTYYTVTDEHAAKLALINVKQPTLTPAGTTETIDWSLGDSVDLDLGSASGNVTLTLTNPVEGQSYLIKVIQGATPRDVIFPASVKTSNGTAPHTMLITAVDDAVDVMSLYFDGTNYIANCRDNYA